MIFPFGNNVTLIGGGECSLQSLEESLTHAPNLIAADGGAARALAWGHVPSRVIGDMDSLDDSTKAALGPAILQKVSDQNCTDFDKVLGSVPAALYIGVGFLGARQDHSLASFNSLIRNPDKAIILLGESDICLHAPGEIALDLPAGTRFSLFPMAEVTVNGHGLVYSVDGLVMQPWQQIGTSNAVDASGQVRLQFSGPGMLILIERGAKGGLKQVIQALGVEAGKPG